MPSRWQASISCFRYRVALRVGFVEMPGGHVQGRDAGLPPARGEVIQVHARPVRGIEERPQRESGTAAPGRDRSARSADTESARSRARPEARPPTGRRRPSPQAGHQRRARPAFAREHLSARRVTRKPAIPGPSPTRWAAPDGAHRAGCVHVHLLLAGPEAEHLGQRRFALQNQRSPFSTRAGHSATPARRCAPRRCANSGRLTLQADRRENFRPRPRVFRKHAKIGQSGRRQHRRQPPQTELA